MVSAHNLICPAGTQRKILSSRLAKNIPLRDLVEAALLIFAIPSRKRGVSRS
jgi:hypothetical protein